MRRHFAVLASAVVLAIAVTSLVASPTPPAQAVPIDRECNDTMDTGMLSSSVCINGQPGVSTRGRGVATCAVGFPQVHKTAYSTKPLLDKGVCSPGRYIQAERIAQTRFMQRLGQMNTKLSGAEPGNPQFGGQNWAHSGVQWEVVARDGTSRPRADIISYRPEYALWQKDPADNPMELWELKTSAHHSSRFAASLGALIQANGYVAAFKSDQWKKDLNDPASQPRWDSLALGNTDYTDEFAIKVQSCKDKNAATEREYHYVVSQDQPGVIIADRTIRTKKCKNGVPDDSTEQVTQPYAQELPYALTLEDEEDEARESRKASR
jgi:hypothetical protein